MPAYDSGCKLVDGTNSLQFWLSLNRQVLSVQLVLLVILVAFSLKLFWREKALK